MERSLVNSMVQCESKHNFEEHFLEDFSQNVCELGYFALTQFYFFRIMHACFNRWEKKHHKFKCFEKYYC